MGKKLKSVLYPDKPFLDIDLVSANVCLKVSDLVVNKIWKECKENKIIYYTLVSLSEEIDSEKIYQKSY